MIVTASPETRKLLEDHYGKPWHECPENVAFIRNRWVCTSPLSEYYNPNIRFLYSGLDEWIADTGLRPSDDHELVRIDLSKDFEPGNGNLQWVVNRSRPDLHADRSIDALMVRVMHALARHDGRIQKNLLNANYHTNDWGPVETVLNPVLESMAAAGLIHFEKYLNKTIFVVIGEGDCTKIPVSTSTRDRSGEAQQARRNRVIGGLVESIVHTLRRNGGKTTRSYLRKYSRSYLWGTADVFEHVLQWMATEGTIEIIERKETSLRYDGSKSRTNEVKALREDVRTVVYIKLVGEVANG